MKKKPKQLFTFTPIPCVILGTLFDETFITYKQKIFSIPT